MSYRGSRLSGAAQLQNEYAPPAPAAGPYSMGYGSASQWNGGGGGYEQQAYASYGAPPTAAGPAGWARGGGGEDGYGYSSFYESHGPVASLSTLGNAPVAPAGGSSSGGGGGGGGSRVDAGGGPMAVSLYRSSAFEPWGFRLQGGADYRTQLTVKQVVRGSPAERNLLPGDVLLSINGTLARAFSHAQAAQLIRDAGTSIRLQVLPYAVPLFSTLLRVFCS